MTNNTRQNSGKRALLFFGSVALIGIVMSVASFAKQRMESDLFDRSTGYRIAAHRSAVPSAIAGGQLINLDALETLIEKEKPLLVDVMSIETGMLNRVSFGLLGKPQERLNIPGSIWLPKFGQGQLDDAEAASLRELLNKLAEGNLNKPMVFYCLSDCWVSWNAARRAISLGYSRVYWFKEGTDVWKDAGLDLATATPFEARHSAVASGKRSTTR